jgi:hypothetical protein
MSVPIAAKGTTLDACMPIVLFKTRIVGGGANVVGSRQQYGRPRRPIPRQCHDRRDDEHADHCLAELAGTVEAVSLSAECSRSLANSDRPEARLADQTLSTTIGAGDISAGGMHRNGTRRTVKAANSEVFVLPEPERSLRPPPFVKPRLALSPPTPAPKVPVCPKCGSRRTRHVGPSPESSSVSHYVCDDCSRLFACRIGAE